MIDRKTMRSLLENMERAAEETLQQDSGFYEALQALKREIDNDPKVRAMVGELRAAGRRVFSSFAPHIKIRVRTEEGVFALPKAAQEAAGGGAWAGSEQVGRLTQELRNAASAVIRKSRHFRELDAMVNAAVGASDRFEGIASEVESAGYEVLICLDLSAYAQVQGSGTQRGSTQRGSTQPGSIQPGSETDVQVLGEEPVGIQLSGSDRKFLKGLKIKVD